MRAAYFAALMESVMSQHAFHTKYRAECGVLKRIRMIDEKSAEAMRAAYFAALMESEMP